ncbi:MAG TPA: hypothetical protein VI455_20440 [Terriglobia bacterium]
MKKAMMPIITVSLALSALVAGAAAQQTAPQVKVGSVLKAKAQSPAPAANAKQQSSKTSIGKDQLAANTAQPASFWVEEADVDDDGVAETSDFLYDAQKGILYTYREDDFACAGGGTANGGILEALYAKGNKAGKPVGSGWYAVNLNATQCGAKEAGVYGCRFDADGNPTTCGAATIDAATGDIDVVVAQ